MMASVKTKKNDLRKLMKERRENLKGQSKRVDSPFAKYNSLGALFCALCNVQIKSNGLWVSHVAGKIHKDNALKKKKGSSEVSSVKVNEPISEKSTELEAPPSKKLKVDTQVAMPPKQESAKSTGKSVLINEYSSSSEDEESEEINEITMPNNHSSTSKTEPNSILPDDIFDAVARPINAETVLERKTAANTTEALPEGFFDDPVLDAKVRNIEYKDPAEEEWERYQKAIAEETTVSKTLMAEDLEESVLERDITQIDEQILQWQKIKELELLIDEVKSKVSPKEESRNSSGNSDDELDEDELLDWRTKSVAER